MKQKSSPNKELLVLGGILLIGLALRLQLLVLSDFVIDSDEAIVGLMAKHIANNGPWPVFYYGQAYMGSLEAILTAAFFRLLGQSSAVLKLVPLLFSVFQILLVYLLAKRFVSAPWTYVAAALTAVGPNALILWSSMTRGGFIELVVLGNIALLIACSLLAEKGYALHRFFALGLILGLGWWVNNQIIFYLAAIGAVFAVYFLYESGLRATISAATVALVGFVLGGLPFWWTNFFSQPRFESFRVLFGNTAGSDTLKYLKGYFLTALPIIFGVRRFWSEDDIFPWATTFAYLLYAIVLVLVIWRLFRGPIKAQVSLLLAFCFFVPVIFSISSFGWLAQAPRYLLPLYSVLFVLVAVAGAKAAESAVGKLVAFLIALGLLSLNVASNYIGGFALPGQPFVYQGDRVAANQQVLYDWLEQQHYSHIKTNYWIGYRAAFETNERITFTRFGEPRSLRIPEYEQGRNEPNFAGVYVLVPREAKIFAAQLDQFGYDYRLTPIQSYRVFDQIRPRFPHGDKIELKTEQLKSSSREDWLANAVDGKLDTRWGSGSPQRPGMFVEIDFTEPTEVSGIDIDLGQFLQDAPRGLAVLGKNSEGGWEPLFDPARVQMAGEVERYELYMEERNWELYFSPRRLLALRLEQRGSAEVFDWSIAELTVYGPSRP